MEVVVMERVRIAPKARQKPASVEMGALVPVGIPYGFWPVVKMSDGTYRKGPFAEVVGRWSDG